MSDNYIDINNLGLAEEPLGAEFDPNANEFSGPPPLSKGSYLSTISFREKDPEKQFQEKEYKTDKGHAPGRYFATKLVGTVVTPEQFAGRKIFADFVSTGVWGETSVIASILHLLGRGDEVVQIAATGQGHLALCRLLSSAIAANPLLRINVDWEGRVKQEDGTYETVYKTMTEFPQRDDGTYDPIIKDSEGRQIGVARLKIRGYGAAPSGASAVSA